MARTWGGILKWHNGTEWKEVLEGDFKIFTDEWKVVDSSHFKMYYPESGDNSAGWYPIRMGVSNTLLEGLIGYWKMNDPSGLIYDELFQSNASPYNGPIFEQTGKIENAINFGTTTNTGSRIPEAAAQSYLNPNGDKYSISTWIKLDTLPSSAGRVFTILRSSLAASPWENIVVRIETDNKPGMRFTGVGVNNYSKHSSAIDVDTWYHLAFVIEGSGNKPTIYLNNVPTQGSTTQSNDIYNVTGSTAGYCIGNAYNGGGISFDGIIDELGVWRKALTSTEVSQLYNSGNGYELPVHSFEPETVSLLRKMTVQPSAGLKTLINTTIKDLKSEGIWNKLDVLTAYTLHTEQASLLDWKGYKDQTNWQYMTHTPGLGFDNSDGALRYINMNYRPDLDGSALSLDSAMMGVWVEDNGDATTTRSLMGSRLSSQYNTMLIRSGSSLFGNINTGDTGASTLITRTWGMWSIDRDSSSYQTGYENGVPGTPQSKASVRLSERYIYVGVAQAYTSYGYSMDLFKNSYIGGSLTSTEHEAFYNILNNFNSNVASYV